MWLCYTGAMPVDKASRIWQSTGVSIDPVAYLRAHPGELFGKMEYQILDALKRIVAGGPSGASADAVFFALAFLGLLAPPKEERWQTAARWLFATCGLTALVVGGAAFLRWRHLYLFIPVALVYAAEVARRPFSSSPPAGDAVLRRLRVAALLVAVAASEWLPLVPDPDAIEGEGDRRLHTLATFVAQNTPPDAIVLVHSRPVLSLYGLAWYARRQFVWYSELTLDRVLAARGARPLYVLTAAPPGGTQPMAGLGPERGGGFARGARLDDPLRGVVARLLVRN
jgi:hypothetical protein